MSNAITPPKKQRSSNIELLRILTMLGVIILHYNNADIGGGLKYVQNGSLNFHFLNILESVFICAVDLFVLITGYFMINTQKRSLIKPFKLLVQVIAFNLMIFFLLIIIGKKAFTLHGLLGTLLPANYFVILYTALYFISPYINIAMKALNKKQLKYMIITLFLIFSVYAVAVDLLGEIKGDTILGLSSIGMYGSQNGYTIVNFAFMYTLGAYINICESDYIHISRIKLISYLAILVGVDSAWYLLFEYLHFCKGTAHSYLNPVVILMAVAVFFLFKKIDLGQNKVINTLAKGSFTVFLLHKEFLSRIRIESFVNKPLPILAAHILIAVIGIYLICWIVYFIYESITAPIYKLIEKKFPRVTYIVDSSITEKR